MRKKDSKMSLFSYKSNLLSFITNNAFFSQKTHKGLRMMLRTTTMKRQHVLLNEMILLRSEKVFFLLSLSLSLLNCVLQQNSSSFYMKFCIKSETTFERRREKKGNILAKTLIIRPYKMVLCVRTKNFWQKKTTKNPR